MAAGEPLLLRLLHGDHADQRGQRNGRDSPELGGSVEVGNGSQIASLTRVDQHSSSEAQGEPEHSSSSSSRGYCIELLRNLIKKELLLLSKCILYSFTLYIYKIIYIQYNIYTI